MASESFTFDDLDRRTSHAERRAEGKCTRGEVRLFVDQARALVDDHDRLADKMVLQTARTADARAAIEQVRALHPAIGEEAECWTCANEDGPLPWPCPTVRALGQGSAEPALRTREVAAGATTTALPPADPASHHYLTFVIQQGRLSARITCTAPMDSLCRLDCAEPGCEQEEQPPHTAHDGQSVHRAIDSGRCHIAEAFEHGSVARCYEGIPGAVGTIPVDAWLSDTGPGWDLTHRHAGESETAWRARDEAQWQVQHSQQWQPSAVVQFRAGFEADRRAALANADPAPVLDPSQPGFSPVHYVMALTEQAAAERDREDGAL